MLAAKIHLAGAHKPITKITDDRGMEQYDTPGIVEAFSTYYEKLFESKVSLSETNINAYLEDIALAWLSDGQREYLTEPVDLEEMTEAICSSPNEKAPGPDGLSGKFYKEFAYTLAPHLLGLYMETYVKQTCPAH